MALDPSSRARFNLTSASVLLLDGTRMGMQVLVQVMMGLGARNFKKCETLAEAKEHAATTELQLVICDAMPPNFEGYDFVSWLRRQQIPNRFVPVLLVTGHTPPAQVERARDCGAHFIMKKPLTPITMLERIIWIAREGRAYIECDAYVGPERRFHNSGPPNGIGRRRDDLPPEVGEATMPNMGQQEVDSLINTRRVEL